jgi:enterochelin esterase-like enzyme
VKRRVSVVSADSRPLAPHSLRERRRLLVGYSQGGLSCVAGGR